MHTSFKRYLLLSLLALIISYVLYINSYSEFKPVRFDGNFYRNIEVDAIFHKNLQTVLRYEDVDFKLNDRGKVLVKKKTISQEDLMHNYTAKALDSAWLIYHKSRK